MNFLINKPIDRNRLLVPPIAKDNGSLSHAQLQPAIDYIHAHLDRDLSLLEIAKVINISPTYFASLFKRTTGISPHQYVIQQRVKRAKLLLSKTDLAIANIAIQVGFSSQSHLTQQFKRLTGMTPKQVRQNQIRSAAYSFLVFRYGVFGSQINRNLIKRCKNLKEVEPWNSIHSIY
ncbi:helix-turn-helix transcriptional regulator [Chroococcidiopsis sp. FACHB-1243]|uniref:AraC family transcriptional regulator n=1 Tax=Chroococcidiopsis sp. [FACHB-1243] TaxID=2692781 RepID=UPI00177D28AC|nr:AraC family transcriptional regulator [Chroococcidiopsis sp. [FACHB-1243]]MBD2308751.1 helix-turn-helix transcriptional regulator [Chroococcidiopsis sp. [FACHB-1243]]